MLYISEIVGLNWLHFLRRRYKCLRVVLGYLNDLPALSQMLELMIPRFKIIWDPFSLNFVYFVKSLVVGSN